MRYTKNTNNFFKSKFATVFPWTEDALVSTKSRDQPALYLLDLNKNRHILKT